MIKKFKDFVADIIWEWDNLAKKAKTGLLIGNGLFLLVFYFIGLPGHKPILSYVIGLLALEVVFILLAYVVKVKILDEM